MEPPRIVNTPEKAAAYSRSLLRATQRMERIIRELPEYWDDLPTEGREEALLRIRNLSDRLEAFRKARRALG